MKRISEIFMIVCFLGLLAAGLAAVVIRKPESSSYWENRALAAFPEYAAQSAGDGSYVVRLEEYLSDHAPGRTTLLMARARADLALRRPVVNNIVVTENALLPYFAYGAADSSKIGEEAAAMAENLKRISETVTEYGGYFCYVAVPSQSFSRAGEYPWYLDSQLEYNRQRCSALARAMEERGVAFLDIYTAFPEILGYASKGDHHYSMLGAFETYRLILEKAAAGTGLEFPILSLEDFALEALPNDYLGSRERKLLNLAQREDRLSCLLPRREVPYTRTDNGQPVEASVYALPASDWETMTYDLYMGGDIAHTVIDTGREELPSILIYGDSFTNPVECIAYLSFDEMHSLDLRHYRDMSLENYIRRVQPEIVVCIRDYNSLLELEGNGGG